MFSRYLTVALWALALSHAWSCPWCQNQPAMKPTIYEGDPDTGGKYFGKVPEPSKVRRYFIAAELDTWKFLPAGEDPVMKMIIPPHLLPDAVAVKSRYFEYTDATFQQRVLPCDRLGIMGPVMRGVVGDYIVVTLLNRLPVPVSLHPHGVRYDKDSEGSSYFPERGAGAAIAPGAQFTYVWYLDEASGPRADEPSSKPWLYHSHVSGDAEINAGLSGFLIVTDPARARADGTPQDVDREMSILLENYDESGEDESAEYAAEAQTGNRFYAELSTQAGWADRQQKIELGMRHAINGRIYGNVSGLEMREGERVRWYVFGLGTEADVHTAHWHAARLRDEAGHMTDVVNLMPGNMRTADMLADNPGQWLIHCHVGEHMMEGMYGAYRVFPKDGPVPAAAPFFGLSEDKASVRLLAAEGAVGEAGFDLTLRCSITAYEYLSVWTSTVGVGIDKVSASVRLDKTGVGEANGVRFRVLNADSLGIVRSGLLQLEIGFSGAAWQTAIRSHVATDGKSQLPLEVVLNGIRHPVAVPLETTGGKTLLAR